MIYVTVGTEGFDPLAKKMDELVGEGKINEKVVIQIGCGKYIPKNCEHYDIVPSEKHEELYKKADLIISHGGAGTIFEVLERGKKMIGVENPCVADSHQSDLLGEFSEKGFLVWCKNLDDLEETIKKIKKIKYKKYQQPECKIQYKIKEFLDNLKKQALK